MDAFAEESPCLQILVLIARFVELLISFATLSVIALMDILFTYLKSTLL